MLGKTEAVVAADNDVIEQRDVHQAAGPLQLSGHLAVVRAGRGIARWMVVNGHHGRGIQLEGSSDEFARKHGGAVEGTLEHFLNGQDVVPGVQKDHCEDLPVAIAEAPGKQPLHVPRVADERPLLDFLGKVPNGDGCQGFQGGHLSRPQTGDGLQLVMGCLKQATKSFKLLQQGAEASRGRC